VSGDVARGEAVPRLPHAPAGLKIPLRPLLAQARRPLLPPVAQHCPPHGRQLLPSPCFQKPPRPRRYLGCSIPRRSRADCCRRAGSPATVLEPPPQPQLPVSSCRQPSWRASATERPPRRPRQAFGYVLGRPCPRPESTRKSTRKSTRSHYFAERACSLGVLDYEVDPTRTCLRVGFAASPLWSAASASRARNPFGRWWSCP